MVYMNRLGMYCDDFEGRRDNGSIKKEGLYSIEFLNRQKELRG